MKKPYEKMVLLLVDDEEDIREVLGIALQDMGYLVHTAENGEEALQIFSKVHPQIVLTDIKMPGMDGIDLLKQIKMQDSDTEVIMITGHGDTDLAIKSLKYEAIDFIPKPINDDVLEVALKRAHDKIDSRNTLREYTKTLENLVQEKAELQDHLSSLGLMIGSISHGIKGLLTRLDAGLYQLDSALQKGDQPLIAEGHDIIRMAADRIKKMVLDILFYAKERALKKKQTDIFTFAGDLADNLEGKIQSQNIEFQRKFDSSTGQFAIDAECLHSALVNILENAIDACTEDQSKQAHRILLQVEAQDSQIVFMVCDNGIGMDQETCNNIFNLFFSAKGKKGTGLGLFIADKIIKQHGGDITVKSTPGQETTFTIRIPKTEGEEEL